MTHDLHDTLAQSFASITFQLHSVDRVLSKRPPDPVMQEHVQLAIGMVAHSHEDARRTIAMLKPSDDTESDLLERLRQQAVTLTQGGAVQTTVECAGEPLELTPAVKQTLLRIGHEAITNAVRHAEPSVIQLRLLFEEAGVRLCVRDDGCGFDCHKRTVRGSSTRCRSPRLYPEVRFARGDRPCGEKGLCGKAFSADRHRAQKPQQGQE